MLRQLNTKSIVIASLISICTVWTLLVAISMNTTLKNSARITAMEAHMTELQGKFEVESNMYDLRLSQLERFVFGTLTEEVSKTQESKDTRRTITTPHWDKNRDEELRKRIAELEKWRLQHDSGREK